MVETYGSHDAALHYVVETSYGQTPANPTMLGIKAESIDPAINPSNIKVRGIGSVDLQTIKKGLRAPKLKIVYPLPSDAPIDFLQHVKKELDDSLSVEVLYYKGAFATATDIISLLFKGMRFHTVLVECHIEDVVKATAELWGQDLTLGDAKISGATYQDHIGAVPWYESYVKKGAATLDRVTDWSFIIENNLKPIGVVRNQLGFTTTITVDADSGQKYIVVGDSSGFSVNQKVKIYDANASEVNWIKQILSGTDIEVRNNLQNTYSQTSGKVAVLLDFIKYLPHRHRNLTGELTFEFESKEEFYDVINDTEFDLEFGLGGTNKAVFSNCKWEDVLTPTRIEDLVSLRAPFVARGLTIS